MSEEITYIATNTDIQVIDTFDPGAIKAISYVCQIDTDAETTMVQFKVVHDGVTAGITQQGMTISDTSPIAFDVNITDYVGEITMTPTTSPTTFVLEKTTITANNYAEHTKCGRLIKHTEGFAYDANTVVIRQANNNQYAYPNDYKTGNTFGPIHDGLNLLSNPNFIGTSGWIPHNDVVLANSVITTNNVYKDNFIYQSFEAELGYTYEAGIDGDNGSLVIGSTLSDNNYVDTSLALYVERQFTPNTVNSMYYSLGHTHAANSTLYGGYLYKINPFNTYRYDLGTFYLKWANTAVNTILWEMLTVEGYPREVKINANGDVQITENTTTLVVGSQIGGNNKLAFSYSNGITASLNGNSVVSNLNIEILDNMITLEFLNPILQFSYVPIVISNTELVVFSNG